MAKTQSKFAKTYAIALYCIPNNAAKKAAVAVSMDTKSKKLFMKVNWEDGLRIDTAGSIGSFFVALRESDGQMKSMIRHESVLLAFSYQEMNKYAWKPWTDEIDSDLACHSIYLFMLMSLPFAHNPLYITHLNAPYKSAAYSDTGHLMFLQFWHFTPFTSVLF